MYNFTCVIWILDLGIKLLIIRQYHHVDRDKSDGITNDISLLIRRNISFWEVIHDNKMNISIYSNLVSRCIVLLRPRLDIEFIIFFVEHIRISIRELRDSVATNFHPLYVLPLVYAFLHSSRLSTRYNLVRSVFSTYRKAITSKRSHRTIYICNHI